MGFHQYSGGRITDVPKLIKMKYKSIYNNTAEALNPMKHCFRALLFLVLTTTENYGVSR